MVVNKEEGEIMKCEKCGKKTTSPTGLCYDCWFAAGSPPNKIAIRIRKVKA